MSILVATFSLLGGWFNIFQLLTGRISSRRKNLASRRVGGIPHSSRGLHCRIFFRSLAVFVLCGPFGYEAFGDAEKKKMNVVATTSLVADLLNNISGEILSITELIHPPKNPKTFAPSFKDIALLRSADVIVAIGPGYERRLEPILNRAHRQTPVIYLINSVPPNSLIRSSRDSDTPDSFFWGDISLWAKAGEFLAGQLGDIDRLHRIEFINRAEIYRRRLIKTHTEYLERFLSVPPSRRRLFTVNDQLRYFAKAYGFEVVTLMDSKKITVSPLDLERFIEDVSENEPPKFFTDLLSSTTISQQILEEGVKRKLQIDLGGALNLETLDGSVGESKSYEGMIEALFSLILREIDS